MQSRFEDDYRVKALADHYGLDHQLLKLVEEIAEVREAIEVHRFMHKPDTKWHLVCEMADVIFVLRQCLYKLGMSPEDIDAIIEFKYARQKVRILESEKMGGSE